MDKQIKLMVIVRNGLIEEVRSNGDLKKVKILVLDLDANPLTEKQENAIAGQFPSLGSTETVDENWLDNEDMGE